MEFQYKENIKVVVDFEIGEKILISDWGYKLDGIHTIIDIKEAFGKCQSGILAKIDGYDRYIDIAWLNKNT